MTPHRKEQMQMRRGALRQVVILLAMLMGLMLPLSAMAAEGDGQQRPNILLIIVDDMGYAELGAFGGEIRTPNIDALAARGLKFTDFNVAPSCSPTRSMLFSGTDNHLAGLGAMEEMVSGRIDLEGLPRPVKQLAERMQGVPGYEGHLNDRVISFPKLLQEAGYNTFMAGKWHIGLTEEYWPDKRGFDRSFVMLEGLASHFKDDWKGFPKPGPSIYVEDGDYAFIPDDFYSSTAYADKMIGWLSDSFAAGDENPFFAYLAPTAPHDPLHVPDQDIDLYKGQYDVGYEVIKARRLAKMKSLGLVAEDAEGAARMSNVPAWDDLSADEKKTQARFMEIYAAKLEVLDREIGRLLAFLEEHGKMDNTVIFFMSDNGAAGGLGANFYGFPEEDFDNRPENYGRPNSFIAYGPGWAQAGSVPFNNFKGTTYDGGIRAPLIVAGPGGSRTGITRAFSHVSDLAPTLLGLAGVMAPQDTVPHPITGKSLLPVLQNNADAVRSDEDVVGWEVHGRAAVRKGSWKLVYSPSMDGIQWELFNIADDPSERHDLSDTHPAKFKEMMAVWEEYKANHNIQTFTWSEELMMKAGIAFMKFKKRYLD